MLWIRRPIRIIFGVLFALAVAAALYTGQIHWGSLEISPASTVTVTGTSKLDASPQIATFVATVSVSDDNKDKATNEVNTKMAELISSLKSFGIAESDIQTAQISVYENVEPEIAIYPPRPTNVKKWQASNTVTIKVRDTSNVSKLADLLNGSGATSVSGPNFTIDDTTASDAELLTRAVADAKSKAEALAKSGGRRLGRMITVTEGYSSQPYPLYAAVGKADSSVSTPVEPGTQTLTKTVTVIYELR